MPFQSPKQRRYMHANLPDIANRWEAKYGLGGIADLNDLPEYYIPKNHGGLIPSHEAGIYGLAEGGNIRLQPHTASDLLVQETSSGERPKYQPPGHVDAPAPSSSGGGGGGDAGHLSHNVSVSQGGTKPDPAPDPDRGWQTYAIPDTKKTTTTDERDGPINPFFDSEEVIEEQKKTDEINRRNQLRELALRAAGEKTEKWEKAQQWNKPNKFVSFIKNAALAIIPGLLPAKLATAWKFGQGVYNYQKGNYDKYLPANFKSDGKFATDIANTVKENAEKMKTHQKKMDLYKALPEGHPERIALQAELEIGKKTTSDGPNGEGGVKHPPTDTSIKFEDMEAYNEKKMELASTEQTQVQKDVDRSKQMAYYRMMMEPYFTGAAKGGRVPAGYNTGGLSNLFRLKNV